MSSGRMADSTKIAEHLYERSTLGDLLGIPADKVNDERRLRNLNKAIDRIRLKYGVAAIETGRTLPLKTSR